MNNIKRETYYLYIAQLSNMFLPLLLIPYLTSVLGAEYFGKLAYSQVISMMAVFFVDFGFNLSAAKDVGGSQDDKKSLNNIFINVQIIKCFIFLLVLFFGFLSYSYTPQPEIDNQLLLVGVLSSVSSILTPAWFLQGIGRNSLLAFSNLFSRVISMLLIFILVKNKDDVIYASFLQLFSPSFAGLIVMCILLKRGVVCFDLSSFSARRSKSLVLDSMHNFTASFITLGFTYFNPLLIKYFLGDSVLGVYSLADKLVNVLRQLYSPLIQANFSHVCLLFKEMNVANIKKNLIKVLFFFASISAVAFVANFLLGGFFLSSFFARGYSSSDVNMVGRLISIMIITQFVVSLSMILVNLIIIPSGNSRYLKRFYALALIFYFCILYPMSTNYGVYGVASSITLVETFIVLMFFVFVKRKNII